MVWWKRITTQTDGSQDGAVTGNDTAKLLTLFGQTHLQLIILEVVYLVRLKVMGLGMK